MRPAYYNEHDAQAAAWLRELIARGHIAPGDVDTRSITEVQPDDLRGYGQVHLFAGIGGWSLAARLAGIPDDQPVWTGSCPCQPFSVAGRRQRERDTRHLWPQMRRLVVECRPSAAFGEQVAGPDGIAWFSVVRAELEKHGYAVGGADLCAAGVGAPHRRQRLYFVGLANGERAGLEELGIQPSRQKLPTAQRSGEASGLGDTQRERAGRNARASVGEESRPAVRPERYNAGSPGSVSGVANGNGRGSPTRDSTATRHGHGSSAIADGGGHRAGTDHGGWRACDWLHCRDGMWRPVEPGAFPLSDGIPARVGRLRGYGNAIVPQVAAAFIRGVMR